LLRYKDGVTIMVWRHPEDSGFEHQPPTSDIDEEIKKLNIDIKKLDIAILAIPVVGCICVLGAIGWLIGSLIKDPYPHPVPGKYEVESEGHTYWSDDVVFNSDGSIWFKPIDSDEHIYIKGIYKVTVYDIDDEEDS
jgi:hypothetical protein